MPYFIGTDEAGYGPNLGPLVISATLWHVADHTTVDWYQKLQGVVAPNVPRGAAPGSLPVAMADSKTLYSPAAGLAILERGVLAALAVLQSPATDWHGLWRALCGAVSTEREVLPWHLNYALDLPLAADADDVQQVAECLRHGLQQAGVRLIAVRSRAIFPEQFNALTQRHGTKGAALSWLTLDLMGSLLAELDEPVFATCDKHGGRNHYAPLLQEIAGDELVQIVQEGRASSVYCLGPANRRARVEFCTKAERYLPAALASMNAKYLREVAMRAFNDFWCARVPGLRPTAGYPQDAKRFKAEINRVQQELGINDAILWRDR